MRTAARCLELTVNASARLYREYKQERAHAERHGIQWTLRFSEWWLLWCESNRYALRGTQIGDYRLQLKVPTKGFVVGNVIVAEVLRTPAINEIPEPTDSAAVRLLTQAIARQHKPAAIKTRYTRPPAHPERTNLTGDDLPRARREYISAERNAMRRGIRWAFTFETWCKIWNDSGHYAQRGPYLGQYCMQRIFDGDVYSPTTVEIQVQQRNVETLLAKNRHRRGERKRKLAELNRAPSVLDEVLEELES